MYFINFFKIEKLVFNPLCGRGIAKCFKGTHKLHSLACVQLPQDENLFFTPAIKREPSQLEFQTWEFLKQAKKKTAVPKHLL